MTETENNRPITEEAAMDSANVLNPLIGLSVEDLARAGISVLKQAILQPTVFAKEAAKLSIENVKIVAGASDLAPHPKDRRFADEAFREHPVYRRVAQSWLALDKGLQEWVDEAGFKGSNRKRAKFVTQLISDALAPTNFLAGNPSALRRARETRGLSLARGLKNAIDDRINNGGMPNQVNKAAFEVGKNIAATRGSVVFEHPIAELIQYDPTTERVRSRPILIAPPQVNKFYVYDLSPEKSMVKHLVDQGFQVFMISWRNPTAEQRDWGLAEYIEAIEEVIDVTCAISRKRSVDVVGACAGGITMAAALTYLAALGRDDKVASMTLMVNVLDPHPEDTVANLFMSDNMIETARKRSARAGVLDGNETARVFSWMRPNDLIWNYVASNYLHGETPPSFDVLYWNSDTTRLPARLHSDFLNLFKDRPFCTADAMSIRDVGLDIGKVRCPVYVTGGTTDHITPWQACYRSTQLFSSDVTFVLSTAGHIQSLINPPGSSKRKYMTNSNTPADHTEWLQGAEEHGGSWWPHWMDWLHTLNARDKLAPTKPGNKQYVPIRPAPGRYVFE